MASTATPYGMRPIGLEGGRSYAGAFRQILITADYATAIFYGDAVKIVVAGTVEKDTGTATMTPVGIFVGCSYTDPSLNYKLFNTQWPAGTVASDAMAYVVDDPNMLFLIQGDGQVQQTDLGGNFAIVQTGGSTVIGVSKNKLNAAAGATTNTLPLKLVDFLDSPNSVVGDAYTDCIVKWNVGHQYDNILGVGA